MFTTIFLISVAAWVSAQTPTPQRVWTADDLFRCNIGTREDQDTPFTPHKIFGNLYYFGTRNLASFLITTPQGHILINSDYERSVPAVRQSIEALGFKYTDIKILLGSHAHADHMEGDALVKELTGAQVMAMAEDVPALQAMKRADAVQVLDDGAFRGIANGKRRRTAVAEFERGARRRRHVDDERRLLADVQRGRPSSARQWVRPAPALEPPGFQSLAGDQHDA